MKYIIALFQSIKDWIRFNRDYNQAMKEFKKRIFIKRNGRIDFNKIIQYAKEKGDL